MSKAIQQSIEEAYCDLVHSREGASRLHGIKVKAGKSRYLRKWDRGSLSTVMKLTSSGFRRMRR